MEQLAILLKFLDIYVHNAHNLSKGALFFGDHAFLGDIYAEADGNYDDVVERMIGLGQAVDLVKVHMQAIQMVQSKPQMVNENKEYFKIILETNKQICNLVNQLAKDPAIYEGTRQLIGEIANKKEMQNYKIGQRIK